MIFYVTVAIAGFVIGVVATGGSTIVLVIREIWAHGWRNDR